jgi:predicted TIM-barrel fold metal-dependent hydrolase
MIPTLHVGFSRPQFPGEYVNSENLQDLAAIIFNQTSQIPEVFFTSMIYKGVFARHPGLRILVAEYGTYWLAHFLVKLELQPEIDAFQAMAGPWRFPLRPVEYAHQHIRVSPMRHDQATFPLLLQSSYPGLAENIARALTYVSDMLVFSSDYPHKEGTSSAVQFWYEALRALAPTADEAFKQRFFGGTIQECLG